MSAVIFQKEIIRGKGLGRYCVVSTMKNEAAFLLDWVAHHMALGFDDLVICTNDCEDVTVEMLRRLQALGLVRHHATQIWARTSVQRAALRQVTRLPEVRAAEWIWVCDADEFLVVKIGDGSVQALVAAAGDGAEVISVPWRVFGTSGVVEFEDRPVAAQFLRCEAMGDGTQAAYPKSLFRGMASVGRIGIHAPIAKADLGRDLRRELPGGQRFAPLHHPMFVPNDTRLAQVNHYALRSRQSFMVKRARGRVNHSADAMEIDYWDRFDLNDARCDAIGRYEDQVAAWRAQLMADGVLARMHRRAVRWHGARAKALCGLAANAEIVAQIAERQAL